MSGFRSDIEPAITQRKSEQRSTHLRVVMLLCLIPSQNALMPSMVKVPLMRPRLSSYSPQSALPSKLQQRRYEW